MTFQGYVSSSMTSSFDPSQATSCQWVIGTKRLSQTIFEIFPSKYNQLTTGSRDVIGYVTIRQRVCYFLQVPVVTESLYRAVFEITGLKDIGVMTSTFQGHVTSSLTLSFDPPSAIFYQWVIATKPQSQTVFTIFASKYNQVTSSPILCHVTSSIT